MDNFATQCADDFDLILFAALRYAEADPAIDVFAIAGLPVNGLCFTCEQHEWLFNAGAFTVRYGYAGTKTVECIFRAVVTFAGTGVSR